MDGYLVELKETSANTLEARVDGAVVGWVRVLTHPTLDSLFAATTPDGAVAALVADAWAAVDVLLDHHDARVVAA